VEAPKAGIYLASAMNNVGIVQLFDGSTLTKDSGKARMWTYAGFKDTTDGEKGRLMLTEFDCARDTFQPVEQYRVDVRNGRGLPDNKPGEIKNIPPNSAMSVQLDYACEGKIDPRMVEATAFTDMEAAADKSLSLMPQPTGLPSNAT
jgi:hypothetical protein